MKKPEEFNLTDEQIKQIAHKTDEFIVKIGEQFKPTGVQLSAIMLGRLMVFTQHVKCFDTFCELMNEIANMSEPKEPILKTEDVTPSAQ